MIMLRYGLYALILVFALTETAIAEEGKEGLYISRPSQPLCRTPAGRKTGELYINTPVTVKEEEGGWVRVVVEGWVRETSVGEKKQTSKKDASRRGKSTQLVVTNYSLKKVHEGLQFPRVYITLTLKNNSSRTVKSWKAMLVAQSKRGKVLFREMISDRKKEILPQGTQDVIFYWDSREKPYRTLTSGQAKALELGLYRVELKH